MRKLLLILSTALCGANVYAQDSTTALYINTVVARLEENLGQCQIIKKDTVLYEEDSSNATALKIRITSWIDPRNNQIVKMSENSRYRQWTTVLDVYFQEERPIRLTSTKWDGTKVILDFDLYYIHDNSVFCTKREFKKGKPDADFFLKWSYELLADGRSMKPAPPPSMTKKKKAF